MTHEEILFLMTEGSSLKDFYFTEVEVGRCYKGVYPDGRRFFFKCTEIEDGDCIGNGIVLKDTEAEYDDASTSIFTTEDNVVIGITEKEYENVVRAWT